MSKRYSKRVRERAATICAIAAAMPDFHESYSHICYVVGWEIGYDDPAFALAMAAWVHVSGSNYGGPHWDAEAEALIRTGWSP
jgi:hypothetical protein